MTLEEAVLVLNYKLHHDHSEALPGHDEFLHDFAHVDAYEDAWLFMTKIPEGARVTPECYLVRGDSVLRFKPHLTTPESAYEAIKKLEKTATKR